MNGEDNGYTQYISQYPNVTRDRVCATTTTCTGTEFQTIAPTDDTNRECQALTVCNPEGGDGGSDGRYELEAATETTDRECASTKVCNDAAEFESVAWTATSNRECKPVTQCNSKYAYISIEATSNSNRECANATICDGETTYETTALTSHADRECSAVTNCLNGEDNGYTQYISQYPNVTRNQVCAETRVCAQSEWETIAPTDDTNRECEDVSACDVSEYISVYATPVSNTQCATIKMCSEDEWEYFAPTADSDRVCLPIKTCANSTEYILIAATNTSDNICEVLTVCDFDEDAGTGEYESVVPSIVSDRECAPILECKVWDGTYTEGTNVTAADDVGEGEDINFGEAGEAGEADDVGEGEDVNFGEDVSIDLGASLFEYQSVAPTAFSNRECSQLTVCSAREYELYPAEAASDRTCFETTRCGKAEYEHKAATFTSNRECLAYTVCAGDQFESEAPKYNEDRKCTQATECHSGEQYEATPLTTSSDRVCEAISQCAEDFKEDAAPTATSNRVCSRIDDCLAGHFCSADHGTCVDGILSYTCDCDHEGGWEGAYCDCQVGSTYSSNPEGWGSPCALYTVCGDDEWEATAPSNGNDRGCLPLEKCIEGVEFEANAPTATSNRLCQNIRQPCEGASDFQETAAPTATSDRECGAIDDCIPVESSSVGGIFRHRRDSFADLCQHESVCVDNHPALGASCDCSGTDGWTGDFCDCKVGETYSGHPLGAGSPCFALSECGDEQYELEPASQGADRVCVALTPTCSADDGFYEAIPATATSDRTCASITECTESEFVAEEVTATSDRVCGSTTTTTTTTTTTSYPCDLECFNGGVCVLTRGDCDDEDAPYNVPKCECNVDGPSFGGCFFGQQCAAKTTCPDDVQSCNWVKKTLKRASEKVIHSKVCNYNSIWPGDMCTMALPKNTTTITSTTTITVPPKINMAAVQTPLGSCANPTPNVACSPQVCGECDSSDECMLDSEKNEYFCEPALAFSKQEDPDKATSLNAAGAIAGVLCVAGVIIAALFMKRGQGKANAEKDALDDVDAAAAMAPIAAVGTGRSDRLWKDFRRCTSFDKAYFGNPLMKLTDMALEDVYALLAVPCPPRTYISSLREVGEQFKQTPGDADGVSDDVTDFVASSIADVMMERAIDLMAIVSANNMQDADTDSIAQVYYEMLGNYLPADNAFLVSTSDGAGLRMRGDAAKRNLTIAEPIYWEAKAGGSDYRKVGGGGDPLYDFGTGAGAAYSQASAGYERATALDSGHSSAGMYDRAQAGGGNGYNMAQAGAGDPTYDVGLAVDGNGYNMARAGGGGNYDVARAGGGGNGYNMARAGGGGNYDVARAGGGGNGYNMARAGGGDPTYDVGTAGGSQGSLYSRATQGSSRNPTYSSAASGGYAQARTESSNGLYSIGAALDLGNDATYAIATSDGGDPTYAVANARFDGRRSNANGGGYSLAAAQNGGGAQGYSMAAARQPKSSMMTMPDATYGIAVQVENADGNDQDATYSFANAAASIRREAQRSMREFEKATSGRGYTLAAAQGGEDDTYGNLAGYNMAAAGGNSAQYNMAVAGGNSAQYNMAVAGGNSAQYNMAVAGGNSAQYNMAVAGERPASYVEAVVPDPESTYGIDADVRMQLPGRMSAQMPERMEPTDAMEEISIPRKGRRGSLTTPV